jgi:hypothetical protein
MGSLQSSADCCSSSAISIQNYSDYVKHCLLPSRCCRTCQSHHSGNSQKMSPGIRRRDGVTHFFSVHSLHGIPKAVFGSGAFFRTFFFLIFLSFKSRHRLADRPCRWPPRDLPHFGLNQTDSTSDFLCGKRVTRVGRPLTMIVEQFLKMIGSGSQFSENYA